MYARVKNKKLMKWFETINIAGVPLKMQEIRNAVYHGSFVTKAKEVFSNSQDANVQKWSTYLSGDVKRQDFLEAALDWVSDGQIDSYMSKHRNDSDIDELKNYFDGVINWISNVFIEVHNEMRGLEWNRMYKEYGDKSYDPRGGCSTSERPIHELRSSQEKRYFRIHFRWLRGYNFA